MTKPGSERARIPSLDIASGSQAECLKEITGTAIDPDNILALGANRSRGIYCRPEPKQLAAERQLQFEERGMRILKSLNFSCFAVVAFAGCLAAKQSATVKVESDEIGGVVSSAHGPEAGVWVIAETTDL